MSDNDELARRTREAILAVWHANRGVYMARVAAVEAAADAAIAGTLEPAQRLAAAEEAHKIAGAVGTFGFAEASAIAKRLELALRAEEPADGAAMASLVAELKTRLEG